MPQLHETIMGERLIKSVLPDIAEQLKRIADALEDKEIRTQNAVTNLINQFPNDQDLGKEIRQRWQMK